MYGKPNLSSAPRDVIQNIDNLIDITIYNNSNSNPKLCFTFANHQCVTQINVFL